MAAPSEAGHPHPSAGAAHIEFDRAVWPRTADHDEDGVLRIGGVRVDALAAEYRTPLLVLDEADFRSRCAEFRAAFGDETIVNYAGKAFLSKAVVRWLHEAGLSLDVCTGGELAVAQAAGFPGERITFHGNNKSVAELRRALAYGVGRIAVDSHEEIERLGLVALQQQIRQRVYVRVTPGVEAHTHEYVATGQEDQKFGFSLSSGAALAAIEQVLATPSLELLGLHSHIGSQIFDTAGFRLAAQRMVGLLATVRDAYDVELPELDLGGGFGIAYTSEDAPLDITEMAERLKALVAKACAEAGLRVPLLAVEPGRAIVGPGTVTIYEVGTVKDLPGLRTYVSVDGGMSDNIRPALYGARYSVALASRSSAAPAHVVTVVGKHCESGDLVAPDVLVPSDVRPGDLIALASSGAYHRSMASNYNHVPRPPVVAVRDGQSRTILRRETEADLLALDVG
jgi:diaminopimelate decarboxylase